MSMVKLAGVHSVERCVKAPEMAELAGVSESTIWAWVSEGCPSETWGLRLRVFQPSQVMEWARNRRNA